MASAMAVDTLGSWTLADGGEMYGLIGKMIAVPGRRAELVAMGSRSASG